MCKRDDFSVLHETKLFTLYNIPSWKEKKDVLQYVQQRRDQTAKEKPKIKSFVTEMKWQKEKSKAEKSNLCQTHTIKESKNDF